MNISYKGIAFRSSQTILLIITLFTSGLHTQNAQTLKPGPLNNPKQDSFFLEFNHIFHMNELSFSHKPTNSRRLKTNRFINAPLINGVITNPDYPACTDNTTRICNEASNSFGEGLCGRDTECFNGRVCNEKGVCTGAPNLNYDILNTVSDISDPEKNASEIINSTLSANFDDATNGKPSDNSINSSANITDVVSDDPPNNTITFPANVTDNLINNTSEIISDNFTLNNDSISTDNLSNISVNASKNICENCTMADDSLNQSDQMPTNYSETNNIDNSTIYSADFADNITNSSIAFENVTSNNVSSTQNISLINEFCNTSSLENQTSLNGSSSENNNTSPANISLIFNNSTDNNSILSANETTVSDYSTNKSSNESPQANINENKNTPESYTSSESQTESDNSPIISKTTLITTTAVPIDSIQSKLLTDINCLPSFISTLPQLPSFLQSNIFAPNNSLSLTPNLTLYNNLLKSNINTTTLIELKEPSQTQLFTNPEITLKGVHPTKENEAYLQVLNSMHIEPSVLATKTHQGLNNTILQLLTLGDQFLTKANNSLTSNPFLINDLIENIAVLAFTDASNVLHNNIPEIQAIAQRRLQHFLKSYSNYVLLSNSDSQVDPKLIDEAANFEPRLNCVLNKECDFSHLKSIKYSSKKKGMFNQIKGFFGLGTKKQAPPKWTSKTKVTTFSDTDPLMVFLTNFTQELPALNSNADIKASTSAFIEAAHQILQKTADEFPETNKLFQQKLTNLKSNLPLYKNFTNEQFKNLLGNWNEEVSSQIDLQFTKPGFTNRANFLKTLQQKIQELQLVFAQSTPLDQVLVNDLIALNTNIQNQLQVFLDAQNASDAQLDSARNYLKNDFTLNLRNVDIEKSTTLINSISSKTENLLKSDFGKSLNFDNLNFIVHKSITAFQKDLDLLKDVKKMSGFILDNSDLQKLTADVIDEIQKSRKKNTLGILDLSDFKTEVENLNKELAFFNSLGSDKAKNAADLMIVYENALFKALSSQQFYDHLKKYLFKYYHVYQGHVEMLQPFFAFSNSYKTLTNGLDNPNALENVNKKPLIALRSSVTAVIKNQDHLSAFDMKVFEVIHHFLAEFSDLDNLTQFSRKLGNVLSTLENDNQDPQHFCFCELKKGQESAVLKSDVNSKHLMDIFTQVNINLDELKKENTKARFLIDETGSSCRKLTSANMVNEFEVQKEVHRNIPNKIWGTRKLTVLKKGLIESSAVRNLQQDIDNIALQSVIVEQGLQELENIFHNFMLGN